MNKIEFFLAADLKIQNILLGIQTHSSKYPCAYCYDEKSFQVKKETVELRSIESIGKLSSDWQQHSGNRSELNNFMNCEFYPIIPKIQTPKKHLC